MLGLEHGDVMLPEERGEAGSNAAVLGLGVRTGTKAKRAQTVIVECPTTVALLRWLKRSSAPGERVVGYTYESYRRLLGVVVKALNLQALGWTPHSPRAGFATDCIAAGLGFARTRELGRWVSEQSLRTYLDVQSAASIQVALKTQHLLEATAYCCKHTLPFFVGSEVCFFGSDDSVASTVHAARGKGHQEGCRRSLLREGSSDLCGASHGIKQVADLEPEEEDEGGHAEGERERRPRARGRGGGGQEGRHRSEARQTDPQVERPRRPRGRRR